MNKFCQSPARMLMTSLMASTVLGFGGVAYAQDAAAGAAASDSGEIIVTAQKRSENMQAVPIAITAMGTKKLDELQVTKFEDYARYLPSVSYQTGGPGNAKVYFRGVASGENANHSTSQPSVGIYLDEQPITTIQGALDVHVYDIARVEALAGPQGTLYGASSEAGTIKIITNKPDLDSFYGAIDVEGNTVAKGSQGYVAEGFVNVPLSEKAALRVVGWAKRDAGYIDNIAGSQTFPSAGFTMDNNSLAKKDYNDVDTFGGRAALKIDLDDNWTVTPQLMGQTQKSHGSFGVESGLGDLQTMQFNPEWTKDKWLQAALTIEGKIGSWDLTYAGAYLKRRVTAASDYSDYSYFYDAVVTDNNGDNVNPNQYIDSIDRFSKQSHELRIASPSSERVRVIGGLFYQRQSHNIEQNYIIDGIADSITVPGTASDIWFTKQQRVDRDFAIFGELSFDLTDKLTVTGGGRYYKYDNSLEGFFGYSAGFSDGTGEAACFAPSQVAGSPCTNVDKRTKGNGFLYKGNITYRVTDDAMVYATVSKGYRPGGVNRRGTLDPYKPDFIVNYEVGFKTSWFDRKLRINGAAYQLDWSDLQLSFLGANGLSEVRNAGEARIRGFEGDISLRPVPGLTLSGGFSYNDAKITRNFCAIANPAYDCSYDPGDGRENALLAPAGTRLPVTAKFKGNLLARYEFPLGGWNAHVQGAMIHEGARATDLRLYEGGIKGVLPSYESFDFSFGLKKDPFSVELFAINAFDKRGYSTIGIQCTESVCGDPDGVTDIGPKLYRTPVQPRTIGLRVGYKF
jgi:outer membrane receptor protein involved in Fe transport